MIEKRREGGEWPISHLACGQGIQRGGMVEVNVHTSGQINRSNIEVRRLPF